MKHLEELVCENLRLVPYVIRRYFPYHGNEWDDLMGAGLIGLWQAARKYDSARAQFSTFAVYQIRKEVQTYMRKHWKYWSKSAISLDDSFVDDEEETNHNVLPDLSSSFEEEVEQRLMVEQLLAKLPAVERDIIQRYYGIGKEPQTLVQIAEVFGYSKWWVKLRIKDALKRLKSEVA